MDKPELSLQAYIAEQTAKRTKSFRQRILKRLIKHLQMADVETFTELNLECQRGIAFEATPFYSPVHPSQILFKLTKTELWEPLQDLIDAYPDKPLVALAFNAINGTWVIHTCPLSDGIGMGMAVVRTINKRTFTAESFNQFCDRLL